MNQKKRRQRMCRTIPVKYEVEGRRASPGRWIPRASPPSRSSGHSDPRPGVARAAPVGAMSADFASELREARAERRAREASFLEADRAASANRAASSATPARPDDSDASFPDALRRVERARADLVSDAAIRRVHDRIRADAVSRRRAHAHAHARARPDDEVDARLEAAVRGLSPSEFERLPASTWHPPPPRTDLDDVLDANEKSAPPESAPNGDEPTLAPVPDDCAVCFVPFVPGDALVALPCGHSGFHRACIREWLTNRAPTCPLCRCACRAPEATRDDSRVAARAGRGALDGDDSADPDARSDAFERALAELELMHREESEWLDRLEAQPSVLERAGGFQGVDEGVGHEGVGHEGVGHEGVGHEGVGSSGRGETSNAAGGVTAGVGRGDASNGPSAGLRRASEGAASEIGGAFVAARSSPRQSADPSPRASDLATLRRRAAAYFDPERTTTRRREYAGLFELRRAERALASRLEELARREASLRLRVREAVARRDEAARREEEARARRAAGESESASASESESESELESSRGWVERATRRAGAARGEEVDSEVEHSEGDAEGSAARAERERRSFASAVDALARWRSGGAGGDGACADEGECVERV